MELAVERLSGRIAGRWLRPVAAEAVRGPGTMEDRPLYVAARAVLRRTGTIRVRTWVRRVVEPPAAVEAAIREAVPQFLLRDVARVERQVPDDLELDIVPVRDREAERQLRDLRSMRYRPPELLARWNLDEVLRLRALLKRLLHRDDWRRHFGRELKEAVQGPLYRYDPDRDPGAVR